MSALRLTFFLCLLTASRLAVAADASYIRSQLNGDSCITPFEGAKEGARIGLEKCNKLNPIPLFQIDGEHLSSGGFCIGTTDGGKTLIATACDGPNALKVKPEGPRLKVGDGSKCIYDISENGWSRDPLRLEPCNRRSGLNWNFPAAIPTEGFQIQVNGEGQCLCDIDPHDGGTRIRTEFCVDDYGPAAKWSFKQGHLVSQGKCLGSDDGRSLSLRGCATKGSITWSTPKPGQLQADGGNCLDLGWANKKAQMNTPVVLRPCDGTPHQAWSFPASELAASLKDASPTPAPAQATAPAPAPAAAPVPAAVAAPPAPAAQAVCSDADLEALLAAIENESFNEDKVKVLASAIPGRHFNVQQVGRLVDAFDFNEDKVTVLRKLRPVIVDPSNGSALLTHFEFAADKEAVTKIMK